MKNINYIISFHDFPNTFIFLPIFSPIFNIFAVVNCIKIRFPVDMFIEKRKKVAFF